MPVDVALPGCPRLSSPTAATEIAEDPALGDGRTPVPPQSLCGASTREYAPFSCGLRWLGDAIRWQAIGAPSTLATVPHADMRVR